MFANLHELELEDRERIFRLLRRRQDPETGRITLSRVDAGLVLLLLDPFEEREAAEAERDIFGGRLYSYRRPERNYP